MPYGMTSKVSVSSLNFTAGMLFPKLIWSTFQSLSNWSLDYILFNVFESSLIIFLIDSLMFLD